MSCIFTDLELALPVLVLNGGKVSNDQIDLINSLSEAPIPVDASSLIDFSESCREKNIDVPNGIKFQFVYCKTITEYIDTSAILTKNYGIPFFSSFATLVIIDYSVNHNIESVRRSISQQLPQRDNTGFVYYKATEDLINLFAEDTHISFSSYSKSGLKSHLIQFTTTIALKGLMNDSDFVNYIAHITNKSSKAIIVSMTPCCLSTDNDDVVRVVTQALKQQESQMNYKAMISLYEIIGMLENKDPGICKRNKIIERVNNHQNAPWMDDQGPENDAVACFSIAADIAEKAHMSNRMIDQGLHVLGNGFTRYVESIVSLIEENAEYTDMHLRAISLAYIFERRGMYGKAALYANKFADIFPEYRMRFQILAVEMLSKSNGGSLVMTNIAAPIVYELTKQPVEMKVLAKLIVNILTQVGPNLSAKYQKVFFKRLASISLSNIIDSKLGFEIRSFEPCPSTYSIRKVSTVKCPTKSHSTVFIYNALQKKKKKEDGSIAIINEPFKFCGSIYNPFCLSVSAIIVIPDQPSLRAEKRSIVLKPTSETKFELVVKPIALSSFTLKTLTCNIYCSSTSLSLPEPANVDVVPSTGIFCARTDFTNRVYFIGEEINFNVWVTNIGKSIIRSTKVEYEGETEMLQIPIQPGKQACIQCKTYAEQTYNNIQITVSCTGDNKSVESYKVLNVPYKVVPGLVPDSLTALREQIDCNNQSLNDVIYLSLGIENKSNAAFNITASFDDNEGLSGKDNATILTLEERNDIIPPEGGTTYIIPVTREKLENCNNLALPHQIVRSNSQMEEKVGRNLTKEERVRVAKLSNIGCYITNHLNVKWHSMDGKCGILPPLNLSSEDILDEMKTTRAIPTIKVIDGFDDDDEEEESGDGEKEKKKDEINVPLSQIVTLQIDFGAMKAKRCELDIGQYIDPKYGILWDGNLIQVGEQATFDFKVCFSQVGKFNLGIKYESSDDISGVFLFTANIIEDE